MIHTVNTDSRLQQLELWLQFCGYQDYALAPASADASFRRYFRVNTGKQSFIVMDAPPQYEDVRPFIKVTQLLQHAQVHVPAILAQDIEQGFLLLTDLGTQTYLDVLADSNADELFAAAITTLIRWQLSSQPAVLPVYDAALLQRELNLFPEWYVARHLQRALTPVQHHAWQQLCNVLVQRSLAQAQVFVHRDYMPRNLMLSTPNPGVLDFQDAVMGPITYDVVSLFRDAFISWPEARVKHWVSHYWEQARAARLPVSNEFSEFYQDFEWMGVQRHLKVLGIFARIYYRDNKPKYLADTPRFVRYLQDVGSRYEALQPLLEILEQ